MTTLKTLPACAMAALMLSAGAALADFPTRPIELIVTFAPGGPTDVLARALAQRMAEHLPNRQTVVVLNRPGGGGAIGMAALATAAPDGYTLGFTTSSPVTIQPHYGQTTYSADSFTPLAKLAEIGAAMNVHVDSPIRTFDEWVAWAQANPRGFTYSTSGGTGSGTHIVAEQLAGALGLTLRHVPFEGNAEGMAALAGRQIEGTLMMPDFHNGGVVRPLVFVSSSKPPHPDYADIPTTAELGIPAIADFFFGVFLPAGTPADRVAILEEAIRQSMDDPELVRLFENYQYAVGFQGAERFARTVAEVSESSRAQMQALGLIQ